MAETGIRNRYQTPPSVSVVKPCHVPDCACTTLKRLSEPLPPGAFTHRNTGNTESVIDSS